MLDTNIISRVGYDEKAGAKFDILGIETVERLLKYNNINTLRHPDGIYEVDVGCCINGVRLFDADAEVRTNWKKGCVEFPFPTVHIPHRKLLYEDKGHPLLYVSIRMDCKKMFIICRKDIDINETEAVINYRSGGKKEIFNFYRVNDNKHFIFDADYPNECKSEMSRLLDYINIKANLTSTI